MEHYIQRRTHSRNAVVMYGNQS